MRNLRILSIIGLVAFALSLALIHSAPATYSSKAPFISIAPTELEAAAVVQGRSDNFTYYTLRADLRRCASPMCGGFFVRRVNHARTRCADGRNMRECYVAEIDWNGHPSGEARTMLLRGDLVQRRLQGSRRFGVLRVTDSWRAASERPPMGTFFRIKDLGIRCITHPCLTHQEERLNSHAQRKVAGVELSGAHAKPDAVDAAQQAMTSTDGVIVAGNHAIVTGPAGRAQTLRATQFYLRGSAPVATKPCMKTGCSGQLCSDEHVITTCEWRREYECYRGARCERQTNGQCGFTPTRELTACLRRR